MMEIEAQHALVGVIAANIIFLNNNNNNGGHLNIFFSMNNPTFTAMLLSMFSHADLSHLCSNMMTLIFYGYKVFIDTDAATWRHPLSFLAVYLGSGFGGYFGVLASSVLYEKQWGRKLQQNRRKFFQFSPKILKAWTRPAADAWTVITNLKGIASKKLYYVNSRYGASGAVFGVLGARVALAHSNGHPPMQPLEKATTAIVLAMEIMSLPMNFDRLSNFVFSDDHVDHVVHVAGFLSGTIITKMIQFLFQ